MSKITILLVVLGFIACKGKIPVILDTDIGQDMDDSWALDLALISEEVDLLMVLTAAHNARGRAQIVAKVLTELGRTDIPIGIGLVQDDFVGPMYGWAKDYDLDSYKGTLYKDGVGAAISFIKNSTVPVTIIAIAPMGNLEEMLKRDPAVVKNSQVVAMSGSVYKCYNNGPGPCPEYNVLENVKASQAVYNMSKWALTITPLDTCGLARIGGDLYHSLIVANQTGKNPMVSLLLQNYVFWSAHGGGGDPSTASSVLYDTVAAYLAISDKSFCDMKTVNLLVTSAGNMTIAAQGHPVNAALSWSDGGKGLNEWANFLIGRLLAQ